MSDQYHVTLPVRCKDCEEVTNKVETSIDVADLPECPNCGSAHFGGGGETELTPEPEEVDEEPEQLVGDVVEKEVVDNTSDIEEIIRLGLENDLSASYVLAYIATHECGFSVDTWSSEYGVKKSTVEQYLYKVESCMD